MARQLGFTHARVTHLMDLLLLELPPGAKPVSERGLHAAVLGTIDWQEQRRRWEQLKREINAAT